MREKIEKLINVQEVGKTMNYIEFPGIDSIKKDDERETF